MSFLNGSSPRRPAAENDIEAGPASRRSSDVDDSDFSSPFDIARTKNASIERLRRWRQAALVLNASRRFRYTLDLKKEEEKKQILRKIRAHAQAIRAAYLFKAAGGQVSETIKPPSTSTGEFPIGQEQLASISREHDAAALQQYGGVAGISNLLKTNLEKGIHGDDADLSRRRTALVPTIILERKEEMFMWDACKDLTLVILMVAAAASLALGIKSEVLCVFVRVIRGGRRVEISIYDIVVGDVIPLNIGNQVPADGILITGHSLAIDESSMTGESKIVHKDSKDPFLMSGCKVADGSGTMLLMTCNGCFAASPLKWCSHLYWYCWTHCCCCCPHCAIEQMGRFQFKAGKTKVGDAIDGAIKIVTVAVTIVVVAVPEGLPLAVTLTYGGFLPVRQWALLQPYAVIDWDIDYESDDPPHQLEGSPMVRSLLIEGVAQNTNGSVFVPEGASDVELGMNFAAARSESSIIHVFPFNSEKKRGGVAIQTADSDVHIHWKGAAEIVLACCTGYMDANDQLVEMDEEKFGNLVRLHISLSLFLFSSVPCPIGGFYKILVDLGVKDSVQLCQKAGVKRGERVGVIARKGNQKNNKRDIEWPYLTWREAREEGNDNIRKLDMGEDEMFCLNSQYSPGCHWLKWSRVTMSKLQKQLLLNVEFLSSYADATEPNIIEGKTFRALSDAQREEIAEAISVMGRSSPNDKLLLVQALRRKGHVVAVTGDGTNDAPALHEADIGLAMGIQGTEVAKESSDIIILDDNFASVVKVVRWGRSVYANIQKFIQFQLTVNVAALVINVVAAVSSGDVPLNAVQLLWVNLIMDTLGALALATEPPTDHLMDRSPVGRREPLITNIMWRNLLIQAMYQVSVLLVLNFRGRSILSLRHEPIEHAVKVKNTLIFNAFVLCQIFNEFNARKPDEFNIFKGVTRNYLFMGIVGLTVVLQIIIIEFLGKFTSTVRLNWKQWLISVIIGLISWPLAVVGKLIPVPATPINNIFSRLNFGRSSRRKEPEASQ
ncbi:P-type ATPase [Sesbania bispinosa]|nr:P-type ATPase [Sesbania bispinosa]